MFESECKRHYRGDLYGDRDFHSLLVVGNLPKIKRFKLECYSFHTIRKGWDWVYWNSTRGKLLNFLWCSIFILKRVKNI